MKAQERTDWPLSPRAAERQGDKHRHKEDEDKQSQQWSFDNEEKGSQVSDWNALPADYNANDEISFDSSDEPDFAATVPDQPNHVGKLPVKHVPKAAWHARKNTAKDSKWSNLSISQSDSML